MPIVGISYHYSYSPLTIFSLVIAWIKTLLIGLMASGYTESGVSLTRDKKWYFEQSFILFSSSDQSLIMSWFTRVLDFTLVFLIIFIFYRLLEASLLEEKYIHRRVKFKNLIYFIIVFNVLSIYLWYNPNLPYSKIIIPIGRILVLFPIDLMVLWTSDLLYPLAIGSLTILSLIYLLLLLSYKKLMLKIWNELVDKQK